MNDKALFTAKLIITLAIIAGLCSLALGADAMTVRLVQAKGGLNVREAPSMQAKIIYLLDDCETVIVLDRVDGWTLVAKNKGDHQPLGWVCSDYLK